MDFIKHLPNSSGHTALLVVIDWLSKQGIFIPTTDEIMAPKLTRLFVIHVFSKHRVLAHVTCSWGSKFILHFFHSLGTTLNMKIHYTSGYHPEGDSQTEHLNQTLHQYLCIFCNYHQDNWLEILPLAEFTYNNSPSATTGITPFFTNKGYHPNITVYPECKLASVKACKYVIDHEELHAKLHTQMAKA